MQLSFQNSSGITFTEVFIQNENRSQRNYWAKAFICKSCGNILFSKNGARQIKENRHSAVMEYIIRYIASTNTPFRSMDNSFLRTACNILDNSFIYPGKDKLRSEMIDLSKKIIINMKKEICYTSVSLLFDSCKRWGENYQGIILYTSERLYIWSVLATEDSKAETFTKVIQKVIDDLKFTQIKVLAICTDNAAANVSAFKENNLCLFWQPCAAHTTNLVISDTFEKDEKYSFTIKNFKF